MIGIYKITSPTGKIYIGQSINLKRRFRDYKKLTNKIKIFKMAKTLIEKIKDLKYFAGLRDLKVILVEFLQTVTALETNSTIVGEVTQINTIQTSGTLIVGEIYQIDMINNTDDFSNIGFTFVSTPFVATGTTPTNWSNGSIARRIQRILRIDFNDIDVNTLSKTIIDDSNNPTCQLTITNSKFINPFKVFGTNVTPKVIDSNNILIPVGRFKIEIFN